MKVKNIIGTILGVGLIALSVLAPKFIPNVGDGIWWVGLAGFVIAMTALND